jgi:hypothetical protein
MHCLQNISQNTGTKRGDVWRHTQVRLINVLHPISYHSIRDDKKVKLNNKLAFLRGICIRVPLDMIPFLLFGDRHCDRCADEGSCRTVEAMGQGL